MLPCAKIAAATFHSNHYGLSPKVSMQPNGTKYKLTQLKQHKQLPQLNTTSAAKLYYAKFDILDDHVAGL